MKLLKTFCKTTEIFLYNLLWYCPGLTCRIVWAAACPWGRAWRRPAARRGRGGGRSGSPGTRGTSCHRTPRPGSWSIVRVITSAPKRSIRRFITTEKAPTSRAFSWLKAAATAFTLKTLLRHYAKLALTPRSLNVKLGPRRNYHKGRAAIRHYANQPVPFDFCVTDPISRWETEGSTPV